MFIIFVLEVLESMLLQVTGRTLACSPFVVDFGDAVMYDGALIWFKYEYDYWMLLIKGHCRIRYP